MTERAWTAVNVVFDSCFNITSGSDLFCVPRPVLCGLVHHHPDSTLPSGHASTCMCAQLSACYNMEGPWTPGGSCLGDARTLCRLCAPSLPLRYLPHSWSRASSPASSYALSSVTSPPPKPPLSLHSRPFSLLLLSFLRYAPWCLQKSRPSVPVLYHLSMGTETDSEHTRVPVTVGIQQCVCPDSSHLRAA